MFDPVLKVGGGGAKEFEGCLLLGGAIVIYCKPRLHIQGSHGDWNAWKMKVVMEKSWNMKNWSKFIEFCDQKFTNSAPELYKTCNFAPQLRY